LPHLDANDSKKIINNIVALGGSELLARVIAFVGTAYVARVLGPEAFGVIGFAAAIVGYLSMGISAGLNEAGSLEVARQREKAATIAANAVLMRLGLALLALMALLLFALLLDKSSTVKLVMVLTGLSLFSLALDTSWVFKGLERNHLVGLALIVGQTLYVGAVILAVHGPSDVTLIPIGQFVGELSGALLLAVILFRMGDIDFDLHQNVKLLRNSGFLLLTKGARTVMFTFDIVLLGILVGDREVGLYSGPHRISLLLLAIMAAVHVAYFPGFVRAAATAVTHVTDLARRSLEVAVAIILPIIIGGWILAEPVVILLFGTDYRDGVPALQFLLISLGPICLFGVIHNVLLVYGQTRTETWLVACGAGLNIVLNVALIPRFGLVGAALARVASEAFVLLIGIGLLSKMGIHFMVRPILLSFLAAGVMGASLIALGSGLSIVLSLVLGTVVYLVSLVVFRCVPRDVLPYFGSFHAVTGAPHRRR
jgi:O-antigen/teichoic acid export membrane protein